MLESTTIRARSGEERFQVHGADGAGRAVLRKELKRNQVLAFLGALPPCIVAMEA